MKLNTFQNSQLYPFHNEGVDNGGTGRIEGLGVEQPKIFKTKEFACKALKGKGVRSGIRVIHAYFEDENRIELVEIYHRNNKENEDTERIKEYYEN